MPKRPGSDGIHTKIWVKSLRRRVYRYNYSYVQVFRRAVERKLPLTQFACPAYESDVWLLSGGTVRHRRDGRTFRDAIHPAVVQRCIERFTLKNALVVCPFTGSGTVLAVAKMMSRRAVGYETNLTLGDLIDQSVRTPEMFSAYTNLLENS